MNFQLIKLTINNLFRIGFKMGLEDNKRNKILLVLFIGVLMGAIDIAIIGPALPAIKNYFNVDNRNLVWIYTIYVLFFMIGTPLMAKLSDRQNRKFIYLLDVSLFGLGSFITASSLSFNILLIGRAIQGLGAGGIFPVASAFIGDTFPPEKRGRALGIIGAVFGISYLIGPLLGGLLIIYGWQWLFVVNLPIAILVIILGVKFLPKTRKKVENHFDWKGMLLLIFSFSLLAYGINQINTQYFFDSIDSIKVWPFLLIFVLFLLIFVKIEKKARDPIIRISFFRSREVSLISIISVFTGLNEAGLVFIPAFAIAAFGFNNSQASLMLIPIVVSIAIGAPIMGRILNRTGSKVLMITGGLMLTVGLLIFESLGYYFFYFILSGIFIGLGLSTLLGAPVRYIMLNEVSESYRASGQGLININTSVGQLIGGTLIGAILTSLGGGLNAYESTYFLLAIAALILTIIALGLKGRKSELNTMK
jgi:EmrB/QacA subfamily drug resistance transporter